MSEINEIDSNQLELAGCAAKIFEILLIDSCGENGEPNRALTEAEMDDIAYCLTYGLVKLRNLPGGHARVEAMYERLKAEQARRKTVVGT